MINKYIIHFIMFSFVFVNLPFTAQSVEKETVSKKVPIKSKSGKVIRTKSGRPITQR